MRGYGARRLAPRDAGCCDMMIESVYVEPDIGTANQLCCTPFMQ
jgi:hypothetical protein